MSIPVALDRIRDEAQSRPVAYLVTVSDAARAHVVAVSPVIEADGILVPDLGRHTVANLGARPDATLVWAAAEAGGYTLLVDGTADFSDGTCRITPAKAILHRAAAVPTPDNRNDCVDLGSPRA